MTAGSFVVCCEQQGILLVKRRDVPLWDLPGGRIEAGESPEEAGIRELREESGFEVEILRQTGQYFDSDRQDRQFIFRGRIVGGQAIASGPETQALDFFPADNLPILMVPQRRRQIAEALSNLTEIKTVEIHENCLVRLFRRIF